MLNKMKQYTTPEQTAKLIELGFEKPKSIGGYEPTFVVEYEGVEVSNVIIGENKQCPIFAYSIGELIKMLPKVIDCDYDAYNLRIEAGSNWKICYVENGMIEDDCDSSELIDALYDMVVKLKEEGIL